MAQFDVYRLAGGLLVVDLQTDLIGLDATRIVAPLREAGANASFPGLTPAVEIEGRQMDRASSRSSPPCPRPSSGRGSDRLPRSGMR